MTSIQISDTNILTDLARNSAIEALGEPLQGASNDEQEAWIAAVETRTAINLGRMGNTVKLALRALVFDMVGTGRWSLTPIPLQNEHGEYTGKNRFFEKWQDWLEFIAEQSGIDASHKSALSTSVRVLQPLALSGQITASSDDLLKIESSKLEVVAGAINKLNGQREDGDDSALGTMNEVILAAQTMTKADLKDKLTDMGLIGRRTTPVKALEITNNGSDYLLLCPQSTADMQRLRMLLGSSIEVEYGSVNDAVQELNYAN